MNAFSTTELARMQATQESAMQDTCELLEQVETGTDSHGLPVVDYVVQYTSACGLDQRASREMLNGEAHVYDASLRLPLGTDISNVDRVRITHRYGVLEASPVTYQVLGNPLQGPSGLVLRLRNV